MVRRVADAGIFWLGTFHCDAIDNRVGDWKDVDALLMLISEDSRGGLFSGGFQLHNYALSSTFEYFKTNSFQQKWDLDMILDLYPVQEEKRLEGEKKRESGEIPPISLAPPFSFPLVESRPPSIILIHRLFDH